MVRYKRQGGDTAKRAITTQSDYFPITAHSEKRYHIIIITTIHKYEEIVFYLQ